jgi:hypothetical protein
MAFFMPAYEKFKPFFILLLLLSLGFESQATEAFKVESAIVKKIGNGYALNAKISYPLTPRVKEALNNGVPITFLQEIRLIRSVPLLGKYWQWQKIRWEMALRYQLRYHPLSEQYILESLDTSYQRSFHTLTTALDALGHIEALNLPPERLSDTIATQLQIRSRLDLHALPTPMRPGALISSKWQLSSPWSMAEWL